MPVLTAPEGGVQFEPVEHRYFTPGGSEYASVTAVLESAYSGPTASRETLRRAGQRGTAIHALIVRDLNGEGAAFSQYLGERAAARAWMRTRGASPLAVEARVCRHDWRAAGTADLIAAVVAPDPRPPWWKPSWGSAPVAVVDWKTGRCPSTVGGQLAAYRAMARASGQPVEPDAPLIAVQLGPDGGFREHWMIGPSHDRVWHAALTLYRELPDGFRPDFDRLD